MNPLVWPNPNQNTQHYTCANRLHLDESILHCLVPRVDSSSNLVVLDTDKLYRLMYTSINSSDARSSRLLIASAKASELGSIMSSIPRSVRTFTLVKVEVFYNPSWRFPWGLRWHESAVLGTLVIMTGKFGISILTSVFTCSLWRNNPEGTTGFVGCISTRFLWRRRLQRYHLDEAIKAIFDHLDKTNFKFVDYFVVSIVGVVNCLLIWDSEISLIQRPG